MHASMYLPVNGDIVFSLINYFDDEGIAICNFQGWPRHLAIHRYGIYSFAQPLHRRYLNLYMGIHRHYNLILNFVNS